MRSMPPATSDLAAELAPGLLDRFVALRAHRHAGRARPHAVAFDARAARAGPPRRRGAAEPPAWPTRARTSNGYVMATLPANVEGAPVIGLIAHLDTSPGRAGHPASSRSCTSDYDGGRDRAARATAPSWTPPSCASSAGAPGTTSSPSSGDTLLGADDKAGVAEIVSAVAHLAAHPELPRPTLRVAFTPDEEIGEGASLFDIERFGAAFAYTLDGSSLGELQDETFSGTAVTISHQRRRRAPRLRDRAARPRRPPRGPDPDSAALRSAHAGDDVRAARASSTPTRLTATAAAATIELIVRDFDDELAAGAHRRSCAIRRRR